MINHGLNLETKNPAYHFTLSDGETKMGFICVNSEGNADIMAISRAPQQRTAMKTTSGNQKYSDFEPPWSPQAQDDFSGGRGSKDFESDVTKFADSYRLNTMFGKLVNGPQEVLTTGYRNQNFTFPGSVKFQALKASFYYAISFTTAAEYAATKISLLVEKHGEPTSALVVRLHSDNSDAPGTVLQTASLTAANITDIISVFYDFAIAAETLTTATKYWVSVYTDAGTNTNYWSIGMNNAAGYTKTSPDDTTWTASTLNLYYRVRDADDTNNKKFFKYKYLTMMVKNNGSSAPEVFANGYIGAADANTGALTTLVDATQSWTVNGLVGQVVRLIEGPGSNETQPWRTIVSNTATALTVDSAWKVTHTTATSYVITGGDAWVSLGDNDLTVDVTDVFCTSDNIYFAQGDSVNIRRVNWYNNSGTGTWRSADDGTNKATLMKGVWDAADGLKVWKANNLDATSSRSVAVATAVNTWGNMTFGTAIVFADNLGIITGLEEYGDPNTLFVFRSGSVFYIADAVAVEIPLREMHSAMLDTNGIASTVNGVYLYFNMGYAGVERFYSSALDDVGPNLEEGLPTTRDGVVREMLSYPGRYYAAIDAGTTGYSSLLGYNGLGWHEIYRAPVAGMRIHDILFETTDSDLCDRLWIAVGSDMIYLTFPSGLRDTLKDTAVRYTHESVFESCWLSAGIVDIFKYYRSIKLFSENLETDVCYVEADYKVDDETTWTPITDEDEIFDTSPSQEINIIPFSKIGVNAKRLKYRLRLKTRDNTQTPEVNSVVLDIISRVPIKWSYSAAVRLAENDFNLLGESEKLTVMERLSFLDTSANELTPILFEHVFPIFDGKTVFCEPPGLRVYLEDGSAIISLVMVDV